MQLDRLELPGHWPLPHDRTAADRLAESFRHLGQAEAALTGAPHFVSMLQCLGGNSPYLADLAIRESGALVRLAADGPDAVVADILMQIQDTPVDSQRPAVAATLRRSKRVVALVTAIADIGGIWPLERVTAVLSTLAEAALRLAIGHLFRVAEDTGKIRLSASSPPDPDIGFVVLGMGKLGSSELNYSSDIDLILLYDRSSPIYADLVADEAVGLFTSRLARDLVSLMQDRDADGYVFRTDLRLRPDPAATPPAVSYESAVTYYESLAQNWERAAMIKARPVAGDLALGRRFLEAIRPFVWRRGLDFAAMADIHAMKRRVNARKGPIRSAALDPVARIAGRDVKLGEGGIREIEFLVQTLQLVWGGRDPTMRVSPTFAALKALVSAGHLQPSASAELKAAYGFLRRVEHRLQMINDRQVHSFPKSTADLERVAAFLGLPDAADLATRFLAAADIVQRNYQAVFQHLPDPPAAQAARPDLDFSQADPEQVNTILALQAMGYQAPWHILTTVRGWLAGHVRALRSLRARELMTTMVPAILASLSRQPDPDEAFRRFDRFIIALPSGVQPMSLFQHNPALLERIAVVLGGAPLLAAHLAQYPSALEGLIAPADDMPPIRMLQSRVTGSVRLEDCIQIIRKAVKEKDFLLSVATLEGRLDVDAAGLQRTTLADATLATLIPLVLTDFAARFGWIESGGLAVVAMGKAGGQEMMAGSDLDLMLIYDYPPEVTESRGARGVPPSQWFVRATHACIAALTAPGPEGQMYAVDMRLRPSGNKGPLAVSLRSFIRYHAEDAWTWERMALTRARVVAGPPALCERVTKTIQAVLHHGGDPTKIKADASAMRARTMRDHPHHGPWDIKLRPGGQVDVEFVAQVLQLVHAADHPAVRDPTTATALRQLRDAGLLAPDDAAALINADHVWRTIQSILRLTVGQVGPQGLPATPAALLLRATARAGIEAVNLAELLLKINDIARQVRALFTKHVGECGEWT